MSLLGEALAWWATQMAGFVPVQLRERDWDVGDALLVDVTADGGAAMSVVLRSQGREVPLGRIEPGDAAGLRSLLNGRRPPATLLRLPAERLLERMVTLPLAAERDLGRVLAFEFDRFTPFAANDVYWSWAVLRQDRARRELQVRLSLVPKAGLAPLLELLREAGRPATGLRVTVPNGPPRRIGLAPENRHAGRGQRRAVLAVATLCVLLALVAAGLPIFLPFRALAGIDAEIERLRPQVTEAADLRRRIAGRASGEDVLAAEAARLGSALGMIALLTKILPDDTYLTALSLRQRRVTLSGQSADAARLIPRLSADPSLRDVTFLSPVTRAEAGRTEANRAELFSLRLDFGS